MRPCSYQSKPVSAYLYEVRGAYDKFPDFFRIGTFIDRHT